MRNFRSMGLSAGATQQQIDGVIALQSSLRNCRERAGRGTNVEAVGDTMARDFRT